MATVYVTDWLIRVEVFSSSRFVTLRSVTKRDEAFRLLAVCQWTKRTIPIRQNLFKMNNNPGSVMAFREERVIIGGVEMTKKTAIAATEQG